MLRVKVSSIENLSLSKTAKLVHNQEEEVEKKGLNGHLTLTISQISSVGVYKLHIVKMNE